MQVTRGKIERAQKIVVYGPEGIGKSTFAAAFPEPVFIDTEGSTNHMDVARLPRPSSWTMLLEQVKYVRANPSTCRILIIDTADWAEILCVNHVCAGKVLQNGVVVTSIEDFGYGKGYVYLAEEFGRLLNLLEEVIEAGIHVVLTAHAKMRKFEQPDEIGSYDRWEMKLQKHTAPLVKEWADMVLFANYKTYVVNVDNQGAQKGKNKAQGGKRLMYTAHHPCWDAKNRHELPEELPFEFKAIQHCIAVIPATLPTKLADAPPAAPPPASDVQPAPPLPPAQPPAAPSSGEGLPKALVDLMVANHVTEREIQEIVAVKGYYPAGTPIQNYDPGFITGVLISAWTPMFEMIKAARPTGSEQPVPF